MPEVHEELEEFVRESLRQIKSGMGEKYRLKDSIEFDVAVIKTKDKTGKVSVKVIEAGQNISSGEISKITFEVEPDSENRHRVFKRPNFN